MVASKPRTLGNNIARELGGYVDAVPVYQVVIHPNEDNAGGYWAECVSLPGCFTDGDFIDDTKENMYEAVSFILKEDYPHIKEYSLVFDVANE